MTGWQPIETAPKGDDYILVALIHDNGEIWRVSEAKFCGIGWYDKGGHACHWRTHWAPMPPLAEVVRPLLQHTFEPPFDQSDQMRIHH